MDRFPRKPARCESGETSQLSRKNRINPHLYPDTLSLVGRASRPLNHKWVSRLSKVVGTSRPSMLKDLTTRSDSGGHNIWLASVRSPRIPRLWQDSHDLVG